MDTSEYDDGDDDGDDDGRGGGGDDGRGDDAGFILIMGTLQDWTSVIQLRIKFEILNLGFMLLDIHQHGVLVILRELMLSDGSGPVSARFTVRDVTIELSGPRWTSYMT
ncbi:unnamed protein product [Schistosoma margrebowiei]|uniref:Uncharacterized protein n=1 Tax=Schistosoma margrebowiei TaxID=48269 RepID=A0A183MEB7_9TREM|nr:unnamed protein product [Schistosoma margrebowiei]